VDRAAASGAVRGRSSRPGGTKHLFMNNFALWIWKLGVTPPQEYEVVFEQVLSEPRLIGRGFFYVQSAGVNLRAPAG
jgi:hypothetical protein